MRALAFLFPHPFPANRCLTFFDPPINRERKENNNKQPRKQTRVPSYTLPQLYTSCGPFFLDVSRRGVSHVNAIHTHVNLLINCIKLWGRKRSHSSDDSACEVGANLEAVRSARLSLVKGGVGIRGRILATIPPQDLHQLPLDFPQLLLVPGRDLPPPARSRQSSMLFGFFP